LIVENHHYFVNVVIIKNATVNRVVGGFAYGNKIMASEVSSRGFKAVKPGLSYLDIYIQSLQDAYHPVSNSSGYICLTVAENKLAYEDLMAPKIRECHEILGKSAVMSSDEFAPFYNDMKGIMQFRSNIAAMMQKDMGYKFKPENVICQSGCGSVVDMLGWMLCNAGDACLIPTPFYPAFFNDLFVRSEVKVIPVPTHKHMNFEVCVEDLENSYQASLKSGVIPKMILITNPGNPSGQCIPRDKLEQVLLWSRSKHLHIVVDEIYARSVYGENNFCSIATVSKGNFGNDLHIVYGFSKDFVLSGFRVGILYSENQTLQAAMNNLSYFSSVSIDSQNVLNLMISDLEWIDEFTLENNRRLEHSASLLTCFLDSMDVPYLLPTAGMFCCAKFSVLIKKIEFTWDDELELFYKLATEAKVLLTPGRDCAFQEPGWYRCCFAYVLPEALNVAFERIKHLNY